MKAATRTTSRTHTIITLILAVCVLVPALYGFARKFQEFLILVTDQDGLFTVVPILNYLLASAGFFMLLLWTIMQGMFRNVEEPKFTMLETEARLDAEQEEQEAMWPGEDDHESA